MTDDNIIGIDGRQAGELRKDQPSESTRANTPTEIEDRRI
jgi:hypothetical protein